MTELLHGDWPYFALMAWSFLAATILPLSSEGALWAALHQGTLNPAGLLAAATIGNVGGSVLNWALGIWALAWRDARWFPFSSATITTASARFQRWGTWSLLLAWLPVIGDPLTFAAGLLRVPLKIFLPLVAIGKSARYGLVWLLPT